MNTEKLEKLKKSLDNKFIPDNMKDKIRNEIAKLEADIKKDEVTPAEVKVEVKEIQKDVEKAIEVAEDKKEAVAKKTRAKRTPKSTPSRTNSPKSTTRKKPAKTVMSVAKEIRKEGESWKDAQARARKMMKDDATKVTKKVESELDKLNKLVKRRKELRGNVGKVDLVRDASRKALPLGKRTSHKGWKNQYGASEGGRTYYERRFEHSDKGTYGKYHLAEGGDITKEQFLKKEIERQTAIEKGKVFKKYKVNVYEDSFPFVEPLMTDSIVEAINFGKKTIEKQIEYRKSSKDLFAEISEFTPIEKRDNVRYAYNRVAVFSEEDIKNSKFEDGGYLTDPNFGDFQQITYARGGSVKNERRHVNHNEDYEVRYAKSRPSRAGYKSKRSFGDGGDVKKQQLKKGDDVLIIGRRWFDRINGNTYHTAEVVVNDKVIGKSRMTYGYEEQYIQTGKEILLDHFELPKGMKESSPLWQLREYGVEFRKRVTDGLKRELELGGNVGGYDLAGHLGGNWNIGQNDGALSGVTGTQYSGLVGETGAMSAGEMFAKGGSVRNERNHVNHNEDYEVRYAKTRPSRSGYKGKRSFADGGKINEEVEKIDLGYHYEIVVQKHFYTDGKSTYGAELYYENKLFKFFTVISNKTKKEAVDNVYDYIKTLKVSNTIIENSPTKGDFSVYYNDRGGEHRKTFNSKKEAQEFINLSNYLISSKEARVYSYGGDFQAGVYANGGGLDTPKIYVADLEAYNNGRLVGEWLDLSDYNDADELNDAIQELLDKWGVEEYAIHDAENLPSGMYSEYMGAKDFAELYEMMDLAKEHDLPLAVVEEIVSQYDTDAVENFYGRYDSAVDFAEQLVDETGIQSFTDFERYLIISETDKRLLAQEMADNYVDDIKDEDDGERLIGEADLDLEEYQEADDDTREEMLEKAREIVYDRYYEEWETGLDDPYNFLVEEQGLYDAESFANANFVQIDYDAIADALEYDYTFVSHDGEVYVFNLH